MVHQYSRGPPSSSLAVEQRPESTGHPSEPAGRSSVSSDDNGRQQPQHREVGQGHEIPLLQITLPHEDDERHQHAGRDSTSRSSRDGSERSWDDYDHDHLSPTGAPATSRRGTMLRRLGFGGGDQR